MSFEAFKQQEFSAPSVDSFNRNKNQGTVDLQTQKLIEFYSHLYMASIMRRKIKQNPDG